MNLAKTTTMWVISLLVLVFGPFVPSLTQAAQVNGLYDTEVLVSGSGTEVRNKAIQTAFRQVLVKATGNRQMADRKDLAKSIKTASLFVKQYRYRQADEAALESDPEARMLRVSFDGTAINRTLRGLGLPVWGATRPEVMFWLGVESSNKRHFFAQERNPNDYRRMQQVSNQRGVPFVFPLLDLEDRRALQASDLWGGFESNIRLASERYDPDVILTGRATNLGGIWQAEWTLFQGTKNTSWTSRSQQISALITTGMDEAVDHLASQYAPILSDNGAGALLIQIAGMDTLPAYAKVSAYLGKLNGVDTLSLHGVGRGEASYNIQVRGGADALLRSISLGGVLVHESAPDVTIVQPLLAPGLQTLDKPEPAPEQTPRSVQEQMLSAVKENSEPVDGASVAPVETVSLDSPMETDDAVTTALVVSPDLYFRLRP